MNNGLLRAKCLFLFFVGLFVWGFVVAVLFVIAFGNRLSCGLTFFRTVLVLIVIDATLALFLLIGRVVSGAPFNRTESYFYTPKWLKIIVIVVFYPFIFLHLFFIFGGYFMLAKYPWELGKPTPSYIVNMGQSIYLAKESNRLFLEGIAAQQGDGKLVIIDSPAPSGTLYSKGSEFVARCPKQSRFWGDAIRSSGCGPGYNPIRLKHRELGATVNFPVSSEIREPIHISAYLSFPCLFPEDGHGGFIDVSEDVQTEFFYIKVGPPGTAELAKAIFRKGKIAYSVFIPTVVISAFFVIFFTLILGFDPPDI